MVGHTIIRHAISSLVLGRDGKYLECYSGMFAGDGQDFFSDSIIVFQTLCIQNHCYFLSLHCIDVVMLSWLENLVVNTSRLPSSKTP